MITYHSPAFFSVHGVLLLLGYIGGKMLLEGIRNRKSEEKKAHVLRTSELMVQGIATSIDALSVGFTIAGYETSAAIAACILINLVTFILSYAGLIIGRTFGTKLEGRANIVGGVILIAIGVEIFVQGLLGG